MLCCCVCRTTLWGVFKVIEVSVQIYRAMKCKHYKSYFRNIEYFRHVELKSKLFMGSTVVINNQTWYEEFYLKKWESVYSVLIIIQTMNELNRFLDILSVIVDASTVKWDIMHNTSINGQVLLQIRSLFEIATVIRK